MNFEGLFNVLIYYLAILSLFALIGLKFSKKHKESKEQTPLKKLYKHCPCRKAVENGFMSKICIYSSATAFMLAFSNIALIANYSKSNFILLILALICGYIGWVLKK